MVIPMNRRRIPLRPPRSERNAQVLDWLGSDQNGAGVLETARYLLAAEALIAEALPGALGRRVKVARIAGQRMTLSGHGAAHAARLRQRAPTLLQPQVERAWPVTEIVD